MFVYLYRFMCIVCRIISSAHACRMCMLTVYNFNLFSFIQIVLKSIKAEIISGLFFLCCWCQSYVQKKLNVFNLIITEYKCSIVARFDTNNNRANGVQFTLLATHHKRHKTGLLYLFLVLCIPIIKLVLHINGYPVFLHFFFFCLNGYVYNSWKNILRHCLTFCISASNS